MLWRIRDPGRFRCWRNKTAELVQAARKARSKERRREHGSVQLSGRGRAPCTYLGLLLLPLADGCLYWLWPCGLRDPVLALGLPTCSVPGGDGASVCSLMFPLCVVICSLPNGQSLVLQSLQLIRLRFMLHSKYSILLCFSSYRHLLRWNNWARKI